MSGRESLTNVEKVVYRCGCGRHGHTERIEQAEATRARVKTLNCPECEDETEHRLRFIFHEIRSFKFATDGGKPRYRDTGSDRNE